MTLDPEILARLREADSLALRARAAALAGDHKQARELRRQFDSLWDAIEAQALGAGERVPTRQPQPAELGR